MKQKRRRFLEKRWRFSEKRWRFSEKCRSFLGQNSDVFILLSRGITAKLMKTSCIGCSLWRTECVCSRVSEGLGGNEFEEVLPILIFDHGLCNALHVGSGEPSLAVGDAFETSHFETLTFLQHLNISGGF